MKPPAFLEQDAVLFMHDQAIREYGGYHGLRDPALLSSALDRPENKFGYDDTADLFTLAAAYALALQKTTLSSTGTNAPPGQPAYFS